MSSLSHVDNILYNNLTLYCGYKKNNNEKLGQSQTVPKIPPNDKVPLIMTTKIITYNIFFSTAIFLYSHAYPTMTGERVKEKNNQPTNQQHGTE